MTSRNRGGRREALIYARCLAIGSYFTMLAVGAVHWYTWLEATVTMSVTTKLVLAALTAFCLLALWESMSILRKEDAAESASRVGDFRSTLLYVLLLVALLGIALDDWPLIEERLRALFSAE